jgi:hypothetical protein
MVLDYMDKDKLSTRIYVDYGNESVKIENFTDDLIERAFGANETPSFSDYEKFLESRCFPRTRDHVKWILRDLGLDSYEPLTIVKKTAGRMAEDDMWIKFVEE